MRAAAGAEAGMEGIERLCALLDEETRVCEELAGVLREERAAVVALRPDAILRHLGRRHAVQDRLLDLAGRRRAAVRALAAPSGVATDRATDLLPGLAPAPRTRLGEAVRALRRSLLEARSLERQTALLANAGLDSVGDLLRTLRARVPGARYGADARVAAMRAPDRVNARA